MIGRRTDSSGISIIRIFMVYVFNIGIAAGVYFEPVIKMYFPSYTAVFFVSAVICLGGLVYAMVMRNIYIAVLAMIGAAAVPWLMDWFKAYWPLIADGSIHFK